MFRRLRHLIARRSEVGLGAILALLVLGFAVSLKTASRASADAAVDDLKKVALSDVSLSQRLMVLATLKAKGGAAATDALADIAAQGELRVAAAACAQLGRLGGTTAKGKLKGVLENSALKVEVREAAAASIAEHWKDSGDISYLEGKASGSEDLSVFVGTLKSKVYGK